VFGLFLRFINVPQVFNTFPELSSKLDKLRELFDELKPFTSETQCSSDLVLSVCDKIL
jgi:hypothetical protein